MARRTTILAATAALALGLTATPAAALDCNWGELTADSIADGFDQGGHSADPSGDGLGREDRVGLANVLGRGDLAATCELISSLLP